MAAPEPPWCCPRCRGALAREPDRLRCRSCDAVSDVVAGIPDLRVPAAAWVDFDADKTEARRLAAQTGRTAADLAREVFRSRAHWSDDRVRTRTAQVIEGPARARKELEAWLSPVAGASGPLLEIGCGTGGLLAALPADREAIGSMFHSSGWSSRRGCSRNMAAGPSLPLPSRRPCRSRTPPSAPSWPLMSSNT